MKLKTRHYQPPLPVRHFDWSAVDDEACHEGSPIGYGGTETEAIVDLLHQLLDEIEDEMEDVG